MESEQNEILSMIEWGVAARALPGESVSGDLYLIKAWPRGILISVVDGLGHGDEATVAARTAIQTLEKRSNEPLISLIHHCHGALGETRGAAMTLAFIDTLESTLSWIGVGNVEGLLVRADPMATRPMQTLLLRAGVLGYRISSLMHDSIESLAPRDLILFVTDGIQSNFSDVIIPTESPKRIADCILGKCFKGGDDALVLAVRYCGGGG